MDFFWVKNKSYRGWQKKVAMKWTCWSVYSILAQLYDISMLTVFSRFTLRCFPFQCFHFLNRSQDTSRSACREVSLVTSVPHSQEDRFASLLMEDTLWAETLMNCQRHYIAWHGHADLGHMDLVKIVVWWKSQSLCCPFWILNISWANNNNLSTCNVLSKVVI